ncbi:MAG: hypothetical protein ABII79_09680 [bacterium]
MKFRIIIAAAVMTVAATMGSAESAAVPVWDTISTNCTRLIVSNTGNFGMQGIGGVNMDYVDAGDCDPTANVYLYDGSIVIGYVRNGNDTVVNFSIFGTGPADSNGFVPVGEHTPTTDYGDYELFQTGKFVTHDSLIAIEIDWYAPRNNPDTCSFMVQLITVYLNDTTQPPPTGIRIGEVVDFNIPADTGYRNHSGFDYPHNLVYQQGSEEDGIGCQPNDLRYGGIVFALTIRLGICGPAIVTDFPHGGYTRDNASCIDLAGDYIEDSLYRYMANSGYNISDSVNGDLHTVMTFDTLEMLRPEDTIICLVGLVTAENGNLSVFLNDVEEYYDWLGDYILPPCPQCGKVRGDVDHSYSIDVGDLTYLVAYLFQGGPSPACGDEGDVDGCGSIDVGDLTYFVAYLFSGGPAPPSLTCWY